MVKKQNVDLLEAFKEFELSDKQIILGGKAWVSGEGTNADGHCTMDISYDLRDGGVGHYCDVDDKIGWMLLDEYNNPYYQPGRF